MKLTSFFRNLDTTGRGVITLHQLEHAMDSEEVQALFASLDIDPHDAFAFFELLDEDQSNTADLKEFL